MIRLRVWANLRPMGWFGHSAGAYFFEYDVQWIADSAAFVLAPNFPIQAEPFTGEAVRSFFANLLPEGAPLEEIINAIQMRDPNPFELIGKLGAELPGVLSILPEGIEPAAAQQYAVLSPEELSRRLVQRYANKPLLLSNTRATMSLPGAQDKIGLRYDALRNALYDSLGQAPTTHIAKPDSKLDHFTPSAINEFLCMQLAKNMKLNVPAVHFLQVPQSVYIVQRYDRLPVSGNIVSLHQIDGCQLLGVGSDWKYQRSGGLVSLPKIADALRKLAVPGSDMLAFQRWVMFNYLIGNSDAHAKNISVLINEQGYRVAPVYDLLCVQVYGDDALAMFIGDEDTYASVGAHSWEAFCKDCGFGLKATLGQLRKMAQDMPKIWADTANKTMASFKLSDAEKDLLVRIGHVIRENCAAAVSTTQRTR